MKRLSIIFFALLLATAAQPPKDALAHYGAGLLKAKRDELASSLRELEQAAKADPKATAPLKALVPVYLELGREPAAERAARAVLAADPTDAPTALALGKLLLSARRSTEARKTLEQAITNARKADDGILLDAALSEMVKAHESLTDWPAMAKSLEELITFRKNQKQTIKAELFVRLGVAHKKAKNWVPAAEAFQTAAKMDSQMAKVLPRQLAEVFSAKGDFAEAVVYRLKDLASNPTGLEPYRDCAEDMRSARQNPIPVLEDHIQKHPLRMEAKWVLAYETAQTNPELVTASKDKLLAYATQNDSAALYSYIAKFFATLGAAGDALKWLESTGTEATRKRQVLVAQAIANNKDLARAVVLHASQELRAGQTITPATWETVSWLAVQTGQDDAAGQAAVMAFNARQFTPDLCQRVFTYHEHRFDWEALIRAAETIIAIRKEGVLFSAYVYKAHALAELDRGEEALAALQEMDARFDWTAEGKLQVQINRIRILNVLDRHDEALKAAIKLLNQTKNPIEQRRVRYVVSDCYLGLKKYEEAESTLRQILDEDPDDVLALNNLGYNLADQGRKLPEAEELIRRAIQLDSDTKARSGSAIRESGIYLDSLGWAQYRRGKWQEAKKSFDTALSHADARADPLVWDHAGDVALQLKDTATARKYWQKAEEGYVKSHTGRKHGRLEEVRKKLELVK